MVTGTNESLLELKKQLESVYPIKASIIGAGSTKSFNALNRRICWGETGYCINTILDTLTFSLRVWGSRMETQCKLRMDDVKDENPSVVRLRTNQQVQISCGQMLVPQSTQSRHNIRRERVLPKNVRSFTTQLFQIETTRSVPEGTETLDSSFPIRGHEFRSDSFLGLRLGWRQRNEEIVESRGRACGTTPFEFVYRRSSPEAVQKQDCMQQHWERQKRRGSRA